MAQQNFPSSPKTITNDDSEYQKSLAYFFRQIQMSLENNFGKNSNVKILSYTINNQPIKDLPQNNSVRNKILEKYKDGVYIADLYHLISVLSYCEKENYELKATFNVTYNNDSVKKPKEYTYNLDKLKLASMNIVDIFDKDRVFESDDPHHIVDKTKYVGKLEDPLKSLDTPANQRTFARFFPPNQNNLRKVIDTDEYLKALKEEEKKESISSTQPKI